jgi:acyl-homoserine-lactone acylase
MRARRWTAVILVLALFAAACSDDGDQAEPEPTDAGGAVDGSPGDEENGGDTAEGDGYRAEIRRTGAGVAHISADDLGSLGFGQGWAYAEDRICTLLDQIVKVRGQRSRHHGAGDGDVNLNSDLAYRHLGLHDEADDRWAEQPDDVVEVVDGYVAGINAHLEEVGPDGVNGWCAGEDWVEPITTTDLYAYISDLLLLASSRNLVTMIATAQPPGSDEDVEEVEDLPAVDDPVQDAEATEDEEAAATTMAFAPPPAASNGWALGSDRSAEDGGMLLANPHFPWEGELRFWEVHLSMPGELDVYGVSLSGMPGVQLGFNEHVAWTHTVSAGRRFTVYSLDLVDGDPTRYVYGDEERDMISTEVEVEVLADDGSLTTETRTLWSSHYGPMLQLPLGWSEEQAFTYRDANAEITSVLSQFLAMDRAESMDDLQAAHEEHQGIPWFNTIATDTEGRAWFADTSATPNLAPETIESWRSAVDAGEVAALVDQEGATLLDGSDPAKEWIDDPAAPAPGLVPYADLPQLERDDYVFNANDSYWLPNPEELLTGYSPMHGLEERRVSARTRMNVRHLAEDDAGGDDGRFDLGELQDAIFSNRSLHAELLLDAMVETCTGAAPVDVGGEQIDVEAACNVLSAWDGRYDVESRGAVLWREFLGRFDADERGDVGRLYADAFDPAAPATTPSTPAEDRGPWLDALAQTVQILEDAGIAVDSPLGDLQFDGRRGDERTPVHGGLGVEGIANVVGCCANSTSTAPTADIGQTVEGRFFRDLPGYPVTTGASFLMTLAFTDDGPVAEAFLTYGQPDDPSAPGYTAQMEQYSEKQWRPVLFRDEDIEADPDLTTEVVEGARDR